MITDDPVRDLIKREAAAIETAVRAAYPELAERLALLFRILLVQPDEKPARVIAHRGNIIGAVSDALSAAGAAGCTIRDLEAATGVQQYRLPHSLNSLIGRSLVRRQDKVPGDPSSRVRYFWVGKGADAP